MRDWSAAKRQCKKDECQTEALLAKARNWNAHVFKPKSVELVERKATLVKECLNEVCTLVQSEDKMLQWLKCLPIGIRESKRMVQYL